MAKLVLSSLDLEYVRVRVYAETNGVAVDPTADTVEMAFIAGDANPTSPDWKAASWETDSTTVPATYYARCLVGTGGTVALAAGLYQVWTRITDSPEVPVKKSGQLQIT